MALSGGHCPTTSPTNVAGEGKKRSQRQRTVKGRIPLLSLDPRHFYFMSGWGDLALTFPESSSETYQ